MATQTVQVGAIIGIVCNRRRRHIHRSTVFARWRRCISSCTRSTVAKRHLDQFFRFCRTHESRIRIYSDQHTVRWDIPTDHVRATSPWVNAGKNLGFNKGFRVLVLSYEYRTWKYDPKVDEKHRVYGMVYQITASNPNPNPNPNPDKCPVCKGEEQHVTKWRWNWWISTTIKIWMWGLFIKSHNKNKNP